MQFLMNLSLAIQIGRHKLFLMRLLDEVAIAKARKIFKKGNNRIPEAEVNAWNIHTFLGKCGVTRNGGITRAAIILLGKYESAFKLRLSVAQVTWTR